MTTTPLLALGLMSGTSADGIDGALIRTDGTAIYQFGKTHFIPYPKDIKRDILKAYGRIPGPEIEPLSSAITELHAHMVFALMDKAGLSSKDVDLIGFHGQTLFHKPPPLKGERV